MRKLLVDRDYNTLQASTVPFDPDGPCGLCAAAVPAVRLLHGHRVERRQRPVPLGPARVATPLADGLAFNAAYTLAHSDSNAPDTGNSTIGPVQFDPYDIEKDRGPDPERREAPHRRECDVGHSGGTRPRARREHGELGERLFGGWTVSIDRSRRAAARTSRRSSAASTRRARGTPGSRSTAWATSSAARGGPDQIGDPNSGGSRDAFFNQAAYAIPAPGKLGNAKKGSLKGPGTWVVNFGFYKDVIVRGHFRLQFSALSTTRSTIRSSSRAMGAASSISRRS